MNIIIFFSLGCLFLFLLTVVVYKTNWVHQTRDSRGYLKKKQSKFGLGIMGSVLLLIILFFISFQLSAFNSRHSLIEIAFWTFLLLLSLLLFDALVIDIWLIGKVKPSFLGIPEDTTLQTMKIHVKKTFTLGWIFIIPIILLSSLISFLILK